MNLPTLEFSSVGAAGAYPDWVRALRGQSGSYVIAETPREQGRSALVVYVGESHTGNLYETLTRHFQQWKRKNTWWARQFGRTDAPGTTYQRNRVLVAVVLCEATQAVDLQWRLIELLSPRDNVVGQVDSDEEPVPF